MVATTTQLSSQQEQNPGENTMQQQHAKTKLVCSNTLVATPYQQVQNRRGERKQPQPQQQQEHTKTKLVYFVRHAEATHNIKEREAVQRVIASGIKDKAMQEKARKAVLQDETLKDAPLSGDGISQVRKKASNLHVLNSLPGFPPPKLVLVSPLRRALMTATQLFLHNDAAASSPPPKFVALEAIREKRTGFAADERSSVDILEKEFPHVDFSDLRRSSGSESDPVIIEDNNAVRARGLAFLEGPFKAIEEDTVAIVSHKGWLREMRHTLKSWVDEGRITADIDFGSIDQWDQTLYKNAEIRVAQFGFDDNDESNNKITSIISRNIENSVGAVVHDAVKHLIEKSIMDMIKTIMKKKNIRKPLPSSMERQRSNPQSGTTPPTSPTPK